jgi:uncharacterized protein YdeI (YjbR/CyaY-like superfamily)
MPASVKRTRSTSTDLPIIPFKNQKAWDTWLAKNHQSSQGIWLRLAKASSGINSVSYTEAVEVALCYGWIDGQGKSYDEETWLQKFTSRGDRSVWSKINRQRAKDLIRQGRMKPAGLAAVDRARKNGRWNSAYDSPSKARVPSDLQAALEKSKGAKAFFATLNSQNRYAILHRIQTAKKPETRARRIEQFVGMLENHEKLYP